MAKIHPTAIIDARAQLADDVTIGAYSIIKGAVQIGPGSTVGEHSHIHGRTVIGRNCRIGPAAFVGLDPQHLKYSGAETDLFIGDDCIIRETATIHRSFVPEPGYATRIGDRCFIMAASHVAHDCVLGNDITMANGVLLGGHVTIGDRTFLGGGFTLHQFCRVGRLAVVAGNEALSQDIPPFAAVRDRSMKGYNSVGCRRAGLAPQSIVAIRAAFRCFHVHRQVPDAVAAIRAQVPMVSEVREILDFIAASKRGIVPWMMSLRSRHIASLDDTSEDA
jgi:UDP-N-acetylglucosamine acyltransferase